MKKAYLQPETIVVGIAADCHLLQMSVVEVNKEEELDENLGRSLFEGEFGTFDIFK